MPSQTNFYAIYKPVDIYQVVKIIGIVNSDKPKSIEYGGFTDFKHITNEVLKRIRTRASRDISPLQ